MSVRNFHKFILNEENGDDNDLPKQNQKSKSGIKYKENVKYSDPESSDFGSESLDSYLIFLNNSIRVMNKISYNVSKIFQNVKIFSDSELAKAQKSDSPQQQKIKDPQVSKDLIALANSLEPTYESHKKFWNSLVSLAKGYSGWSDKLGSTRFYGFDASGNIKKAYAETVGGLESDIDRLSSDPNSPELAKKKKELESLKKSLKAELEEKDVRGVMFTRNLDKILTLYVKAIESYKNGAMQELNQMENESKDEGRSRLNSLTGKTIRAIKSIQ
jgi:hypothetical protein